MTQHADDTENPLVQLADDVNELTTARVNAARFVLQDVRGRAVKNDVHYTPHPSLLDQLRAAGSAGRGGDAAMSGGYESRPAARLEAVDVLHGIERDVDDWIVRRFGAEPRPSIEDNLRALVGLAATADIRMRAELARASRGWKTWARVLTGWDSAPWRPNAGCPVCEHNGGLRVRLEDRVAACTQCQETWDPSTIGLLADHIREVNADARTRRQQAAELRAELDGFFAYRGPCLSCTHASPAGLPPMEAKALVRRNDARHRLIDELVDLVLAGHREDLVAEQHGVPVEAVRVAVAVATWPAGDEPAVESQSA